MLRHGATPIGWKNMAGRSTTCAVLDAAAAETQFQRSLDIAYQQGALSWELRAATSLAGLRQDQGRIRDAHDLLASAYGRFTEGFATAGLIAARALLNKLVNKPAI
jgi:predicted ATPase